MVGVQIRRAYDMYVLLILQSYIIQECIYNVLYIYLYIDIVCITYKYIYTIWIMHIHCSHMFVHIDMYGQCVFMSHMHLGDHSRLHRRCLIWSRAISCFFLRWVYVNDIANETVCLKSMFEMFEKQWYKEAPNPFYHELKNHDNDQTQRLWRTIAKQNEVNIITTCFHAE